MTALLTADTDREAWLAARRKGIGASEIAAVLGISPWESPFSLYWRKVNGWDYEPSAEMEWGTRLEDAIARKYEDAHPDLYVQKSGLCVGHEPWMLATPDRLIGIACRHPAGASTASMGYSSGCSDCMNTGMGEPPHGVLELKTAHSADGWGEPGTDDIPVYYRAQVLWQMLIADVPSGEVAVLIGGSQYREYLVRYDARDLDVMFEAGRRFMARIEAGDPPPIDDHHATISTLKRLHPDLEDTDAEVPESVAAGYARACEMERKAKAVKKRYEARLLAAMGAAKRATVGGRKVATRVIADVAGYTVDAHRKDYLLAAKGKKS
jgi:putative phage-type endonuclease